MEESASFFKKQLSVRQKANFSNLPIELVEKIVKETDLPSRLALRKVSKRLRNLVVRLDPVFKHVGIHINSKCIKLDLDGESINYRNGKYDKCLVAKSGRKPKKFDGDNVEVMINDLLTFMSPALRLEHFAITFTDIDSYEEFRELRSERMPFNIKADSFFFKANANKTCSQGTDMFNMMKLRQLEYDWMEEGGSWIQTDGRFHGGESFLERIPKGDTRNQKERKIKDQESGRPGNNYKGFC